MKKSNVPLVTATLLIFATTALAQDNSDNSGSDQSANQTGTQSTAADSGVNAAQIDQTAQDVASFQSGKVYVLQSPDDSTKYSAYQGQTSVGDVLIPDGTTEGSTNFGTISIANSTVTLQLSGRLLTTCPPLSGVSGAYGPCVTQDSNT
jgi:hypothetical protein